MQVKGTKSQDQPEESRYLTKNFIRLCKKRDSIMVESRFYYMRLDFIIKLKIKVIWIWSYSVIFIQKID